MWFHSRKDSHESNISKEKQGEMIDERIKNGASLGSLYVFFVLLHPK